MATSCNADSYRLRETVEGWEIQQDIGGNGFCTPFVMFKTKPEAEAWAKKNGRVLTNTGVDAETACNASYSNVLKDIMDSVKPYMDKRIKGDMAWKYPMLVITVLRKVCDKAVMSAGRYDGQRPPHRVYDLECVKDGWKFQGNLVITGLLHRNDPDDVSAFDEYDMTMSLMNVGKATNSTVCNYKVGDRVEAVRDFNTADVNKGDRGTVVQVRDNGLYSIKVKFDRPNTGCDGFVAVSGNFKPVSNSDMCGKTVENMSAQQYVTQIEMMMPFRSESERWEAKYILDQHGAEIMSALGSRGYRDLVDRIND